jgi:membrane-bound lytic murein transglycosylase F
MKRVLPLLAQARYYSHLKSGKGRGGEAVIMVENIRVYTDILNRYEQPYRPLEFTAEPIGGKSSPSYFPLQNLSP